ncbi:DUF2946 domain-containing protein [Citrobacter farmeri]|uniref:DUF2946 domain-containing protein n=1 Tax=Citrobacter farmeri TaxID=67824 RepID=UPI0018A8C9EE|nr:DUF2946 domain-containing protein [Citrobacter farmeri]MDB2179854.1 DUF2946 domain-containing protein [Citrobacter farmeri]
MGKIRQSGFQQHAVCLALFAILLIVIAPLISVALQKDPMSAMPGMHHEMSTMTEHEEHDRGSPPAPLLVDHGEACGYCVLLAHVPGIILALVILLCGVLLRVPCNPIRPTVQHWHFFPWLYPDTRAPPRRSALSCF